MGTSGRLLLWLAAAPLLAAQSANEIGQAWDQILGSALPAPPKAAPLQSPADNFLNRFYFESRSNYERYHTSFTGNPTYSGVINAPDTGIFNPAGIPSLTAFQPGSNRVQEFLDFGTRGYGSGHIDTHFALRYRQDLTRTDIGSPAENVTETFHGSRLYEFLEAEADFKYKPVSFQLGRLNIYGAELASFDGGALTVTRPGFNLTVYGGRRFSWFSDPRQRAMGGANLNLKLSPTLSVELETLWYVKGSNRGVIRKRVHSRWILSSSLRAYGGNPVDFNASGLYSSRNGKDTLRAAFFQKLTDKDYTFDYTTDAQDLAPKNRLYRLYLGPISQYSQVNVEAHRQLFSNLRGGAAATVRRLNDRASEGPFDTSFEDYRFNGQYFPLRKLETFFEYHQRHSDRLNPFGATTLDDLHSVGDTSVKDATAEIRRSFGDGRLNLSGGVYYRRISLQDSFFSMKSLHQSGLLAGAWVRLDRRTRVYFDYSLDNDFYLFSPDLKNSQVLRLGAIWKY